MGTVEGARMNVDCLPSALSDDPLLEFINETRQFCMEHGLLLDVATVSSEVDRPHPGKRDLDTQDDLPLAKVFRPMPTAVKHEQEQPQVLQQEQLQQLTSRAASIAPLDELSFPRHPQGRAKVASGLDMSASAKREATTRQDLHVSASGWLSTPRKQLQPVHSRACSEQLMAADWIATPQRPSTLHAQTHSGQAQQGPATPPCTELKLTCVSSDAAQDDVSVLGLLDRDPGLHFPVKPSDAAYDHPAYDDAIHDEASVLNLLKCGPKMQPSEVRHHPDTGPELQPSELHLLDTDPKLQPSELLHHLDTGPELQPSELHLLNTDPKLQPSELLHHLDTGPDLQPSDGPEANLARGKSGDDWLDALEM